MGSNTTFMGTLLFTQPLTVPQYRLLETLLGTLELTENADGLRWDGSEKTYRMDQIVNVLLSAMRRQWPDFGLRGQLLAQGEEPTDRWTLAMGADGWAHRAPALAPGRAVQCPCCGETFTLEE